MAMTIVFARKATVLVDPREFDNDIQTPVAVNEVVDMLPQPHLPPCWPLFGTASLLNSEGTLHNALSINAKNAQKLAQAHAQFKQILEGHVQKH
ncbi:13114_t:CDS:2 [Entrophospora sp. SA101]|nr:13114_t:CDS:2 [Entrophospora sp. SA101]